MRANSSKHPIWMDFVRTSEEAGTRIRCHQASLDTESLLKRFCDVEAVPERTTTTEEDRWCEDFFQKTHIRREDGRYVVRLPFKTYLDPSMVLGRSHQMALNRFLHLERRLSIAPERWRQYKEEIEEYFTLQQIAPAVGSENGSMLSYSSVGTG